MQASFNRTRCFAQPLPLNLFGVLVLLSAVGCQRSGQKWDEADRQFFYTTDQGSQLMPYAWFMALERPAGAELFRGDDLSRFGYIANPKGSSNPDGLPIGFVKDVDRTNKAEYIGLTCAACHTGQIEYGGKSIRIDGAPALADAYKFIVEIDQSLNATLKNDGGKFGRFADSVLGKNHSQADETALRNTVSKFSAEWNEFVKHSTSPVLPGRGRLDAFGMIFNRVAAIDLQLAENNSPPDAPVSYPFIWGSTWHDVVQWNGSAGNKNDIERLGRNVGEVLGVFGTANLVKPTVLHPYYETSARRRNQIQIENRLKRLSSPVWPEDILGPIDANKKKKGQQLYAKYCVRCHEVVPHGEQTRRVRVDMIALDKIGTDRKMAENAVNRKVKTGRLEGARLLFLKPLPAEINALNLVGHVAVGAILEAASLKEYVSSLPENVPAAMRSFRESSRADFQKLDETTKLLLSGSGETYAPEDRKSLIDQLYDFQNDLSELFEKGDESKLLAYEARPLDGIWATAPYLHNGSVPNLYELLLPQAQRSKKFYVGSVEFDPKNVGYATSESPGATLLDTSVSGNLNCGHDSSEWGNPTFSEDDRWALVEYMKSL